MWRLIAQRWRIFAAATFSVAFVAGAYMLARGIPFPSFGGTPMAYAATQDALLQTLATKDSNGDGVPDWEKPLYGIPVNATTTDYFHLGMTDGQAIARGLIVPKAQAEATQSTSTATDTLAAYEPKKGTLTNAFTQNFLALYAQAKAANGGAALSQSNILSIVNQAVSSLKSSVAAAPTFKTAGDLNTTDSSVVAYKAFAAQAEAILHKNMAATSTNELDDMKALLSKNDMAAKARLQGKADFYEQSATGIAMLPVPASLASADLNLVNTMMRTGQIIHDFTLAGTDPLTALLALKQYKTVVTDMGVAFAQVGAAYQKEGVSLPSGVPGASFISFVEQTRTTVVQTAQAQASSIATSTTP